MLTDGFMESNVQFPLTFDEKKEFKPPADLKLVLDLSYHYLAKGCQAYVFASEDGQYVLKLFKFKRFHEPFLLSYFDFIPIVDRYLQAKRSQKREALNFALQAWQVAFNELKAETGLVYVHLNPTANLNQKITFYDKIGLKHVFEADETVFMVQHKAEMMVPWIQKKLVQGDTQPVEKLLSELVYMLKSEYERGVNDCDLALMQNTGIFQGHPFHIDVGQFYLDESFKDPKVWKEELFLKTYELRDWLRSQSPPLEQYLSQLLKEIIGPEFQAMKPFQRPGKAHI